MNIGILGLGTVGGGVVNVLNNNKKTIERRTGSEINIAHAAVKNINDETICSTKNILLTEDAFEVVNNPNIDVILELIGGIDLPKKLIEAAIRNGKHVITANKALIANHGNELLDLAKENNTNLLFEASVAGGVPILKSIEQGLGANKIELVAGIINGTGNFILTEMRDKGRSFHDVLKEAQDLGYAESDPTYDVEGIDAAHKLAILSSMAFGCKLEFDNVSTIGISEIEGEDVSYAGDLGYYIKHLGIAKKINDEIEMRVHPTLIPKTTLLANVDGVMNAVLVNGNAVGTTLYYGAGAGSDATASAVIADLLDIMNGTVNNDILGWKELKEFTNKNNNSIESIFYLRFVTSNESDVLDGISSTLKNHNISIESVIQKKIDGMNTHVAVITSKSRTSDITEAVNNIKEHDFVKGVVKIIHVETLN
ncbi:MAG TPA: homoserine dehydrogenase [Candidatus Thioglobus sp.]|jgi:homoserine dehydrogenase|nr:homoserine dehydrogenase [Candidatus Thioglobus sp.]HIL42502.1 homoserine dehydrogenase [Gammaproteobacteria bacterium]